MTKEEVLKKYDVQIPDPNDILHRIMDEYAKQEAIGFYNWQILVGEDSEFMYQHLDDSPEQLYELYEQSKNKAQ